SLPASTRQARERVLCEGPAAEDRHRSGASGRSLIPGSLESEDQWM
ncbi:mCG140348, isoform CRA_a, partial [Mus musculus]